MAKKQKKRADGRYQKRVTLSPGNSQLVYGRTLKERDEKVDALKLAYATGVTNLNKKITVQQWGEKWWPIVKKGKTGHNSQYEYTLSLNNYIFPYMGHIRLIDVRSIHCQQLINNMGEQGKSKSMQQKVRVTLNGMFKSAVINGLISGNPAQYLEFYDVPVEEKEPLTTRQVTALLDTCRGFRSEVAIHLALYCGLRRGEIVALKWSNLDENNQAIRVKNSVEFIHNQPKEKDPKSTAGKRIIPVPPHLWVMLQAQPKRSMFVVPSAANVQMSETAFRRLLEPVQNRVDFHFSAHILRHTYATVIDRIGVSPKTCQYLLGHAELSTTKNIYTHIQEEHIKIASVQLQNIYTASTASQA